MKERFLGLVNKYRSLRAQRDAGKISDEEYRSQLEASAIPDADKSGHWWNISPESGLWIYFDGNTWTTKTPKGFDPDVGPITPIPTRTTKIRRRVGARGAVIAVIVVVAIAAVAIVAWILIQQLGGLSGNEKAKEEIEKAIDDLYEALDAADAVDLEDLATGSFARTIEREREGGTLNSFAGPYRNADFEVDEITIEGGEATATVAVSRGGQHFEQEVDLELDEGDWKIADMGRLRPIREQPSERTDETPGEESARNVAERFFQFYKALDFESLKIILAGEALSDLEGFENELTDPSQFDEMRESLARLTWDILDISFSESGNQATVSVRVSTSDVPLQLNMRVSGNQWKIYEISSESR